MCYKTDLLSRSQLSILLDFRQFYWTKMITLASHEPNHMQCNFPVHNTQQVSKLYPRNTYSHVVSFCPIKVTEVEQKGSIALFLKPRV